MAEKSASPRASASLRSASPMLRTVGRTRTVSAPMRTCSCAMVVPPETTRVAPPLIGHAVPRPRDGDNTARENLFGTMHNRHRPTGESRCGLSARDPIWVPGRRTGFCRAAREKESRLGRRPFMPRDIIGRAQIGRAQGIPAAGMIALALGAAAFGAVAVGALAIGRLALGRVTVKRARFEALEVDELTVRKLRVREYEGPPPQA